jgi:hypothetical protein
MFISGPPSNRAHFPYQAGLRGNSSPPDPPFSLCPCDVRAAPPPLSSCASGRCRRPSRCLGLHPYVSLTGQPDPPPSSPPLRAVPHTSPLLFPRMGAEPECTLVAATTPGHRYRAVSNQADHHFHWSSGCATLPPHQAPLHVLCLRPCWSSWAERSSLRRVSPSAAAQVRLLLLVAVPGRVGRPLKRSCLVLLLRGVAGVRPPKVGGVSSPKQHNARRGRPAKEKEKCFQFLYLSIVQL